MRNYFLLLFLLIGCLHSLLAQVTFTGQIAPIIYNKCTGCHRPGNVGPMPFTSYKQIADMADMIVHITQSGKMPPWMPDTKYSHFLNERALSKQETDLIAQWVKEGKPCGDVAAEPELPLFPTGSVLGKPDLTVSMKQAYTHKGTNKDEYRVFVLPTNLTQGHYVKAIEICPGNAAVAHHIILGLDTTHRADKIDVQDTAYGYAQYGGFGFYPTYDNWSGWIPGNTTRFLPEGICNYILPNSSVLLQMHYAPSPIDVTDSTVVNIYYADKPGDRFIHTKLISPVNLTNGPFFIPANRTKTFNAEFKAAEDYSLVSITPHAHWLCKNWLVYAVSAKGDTTHLVKINDWDFDWQNFFAFPKLIKLEKGSTIYASATFDNTANNYANPNNPPKNVMWGESARDEMFLCYFAHVPYKKGDENIILTGGENAFAVSKTGDNNFALNYSLAEKSSVDLKLCNSKGIIEKQILEKCPMTFGAHQSILDTAGLKPGTYWCKLSTSYFSATTKIVIP